MERQWLDDIARKREEAEETERRKEVKMPRACPLTPLSFCVRFILIDGYLNVVPHAHLYSSRLKLGLTVCAEAGETKNR